MTELRNKDGSVAPKRPDEHNNLKEVVTLGVDEFLSSPYVGDLVERRDDLIQCFIDGNWRPFINIYELAKDGFDDWFDIDMEFLGYLEDMDGCIDKALKDLEKQWGAENDITPPFSIGDRLTFISGFKQSGGVITDINLGNAYHVHSFLVKEDSQIDDGRRVVIKFENARAE